MKQEISILPYRKSLSAEWDALVDESRNGTFLHKRGFMDYHSDRFEDASLMVMRGDKAAALLPASASGGTVYSHAGLTYGGLLTAACEGAADVLESFRLIAAHYREEGFKHIVYKPVPHIYHRYPAEEDLYALFRMDAVLTARNVSSALAPASHPDFKTSRKGCIRKAAAHGLTVRTDTPMGEFWEILECTLRSRHNATPVHSLEEISLLATRFPGNIRLYTACLGRRPLAGMLMFDTAEVAHVQYMAASPEGRSSGALDLIVSTLINVVYKHKKWFDFGISNENGGRLLNEGLAFQKEGFGASTVCYDTYRIDLT